MKNGECPNCSSPFIKDTAEHLHIDQNRALKSGDFLTFICSANCGYEEGRPDEEAYPRIIAERRDSLLLLYPNDQGRVYKKTENTLYPAMHVEAILRFGGWDEYNGEHTAVWVDAHAEKAEEPKSLFAFAASELLQDSFLCWFVQWAGLNGEAADKALHKTAQLFLERIFRKHGEVLPEIKSLKVIQQFKELDILILVNEHAAVLIEGKTCSSNYSDQLVRYLEAVKQEYPNRKPLPIFYQSASQSHYRSYEGAGYRPFIREEMMNVMNEGKSLGVQNDVFLDYLKRLEALEAGYQSYRWLPVSGWTSASWQGFYRLLQSELGRGDWGYVANGSGGFQGFWWTKDPSHACYFQIEQSRLCIKLAEPDPLRQREARMKAFTRLIQEDDIKELFFQKPVRYQNGKIMTIMVKTDYLQMKEDGGLDIQNTVRLLKEIDKKITLF
ncbi:PD-(D/E)XK nuclease family protein [Domibacillus robiginosus]|uniref:PD-(D/E)XK nuclease family protein n=1 Tax=Domibacillus robiginosus TaxID=1071054 RepID=UPI00067ABFEA|nr:PD-(D/E)XK nuclease family protein [Domibacillus robiginosus]